jgi:hypothetical protein
MTQSNKSLRNMIVMAVVVILAMFAFTACGGSSPTEPRPDPTPVPSPTPTPRPAQTFTFTISATEVTPKEVTAWPGDTILFVSTDPVGEFGIRGNSGILTSPYIPPLGSWSLVLPDFGEIRTLTFYNSLKSTDSNFFGTIKLQTKL